jgi:nucleotide-binding universal stress UspA family protein
MTRETVVVGVDQSVQSAAALQWAVRYARRTGASLRVVSVHPHWMPTLPYAAGVAGMPLVHQESWDEQSHAAIRNLFNSIRPEPHWKLTQIDGKPGPELMGVARDASLLVVGTREHVGIDRFLEGSVSHYCVRHAHVPVVLVPAPLVPATEAVTTRTAAVATSAATGSTGA